ncbi:hypothetical protein [Mucilaginibacter gracilis]|uniref:hypothetical protein n=1 Tax=Mucilaginibacter gracilis TaxID=423350 RepID=UPI000EAC0E13|nr:hypothetical protein [Mucilaginibacter gracilis]
MKKDFGGHWRTVHPEHIEYYEDLFYEALEQIETEPAKEEKKLKKTIITCGNGYLDAILQLGSK